MDNKMNSKEKLIVVIAFVMTAFSITVLSIQINFSRQISFLAADRTKTTVTVNWYDSTQITEQEQSAPVASGETFIINNNSKVIHSPDCRFAQNIKQENKTTIVTDDLSEYLENGYSICSNCGAGIE